MKHKIKNIKDYQALLKFVAVNAHNLLLDSHIPGEQAHTASEFMKKCKEIVEQLDKLDE
jgi:hypothetical protein